MQMLARSSEEGRAPGLGWIDGVVRKFDASALPHKTRLPHMGWNTIKPKEGAALFRGLDEGARFYFLHSFYFECGKAEEALAVADYGGPFACAVGAENIFGVQFHPEKSHSNGITLLRNFGSL
jgi:glutamine amidotransferase